jgi:carbon starvation protein
VQRLIFNDRLDAVVTGVFAILVVLILVESARQWWMYAFGQKEPVLNEGPMVVSKWVVEGGG